MRLSRKNAGFIVALSIMASLSAGCFESDVEKVTNQIDQSTAALTSDSNHWQDSLKSLEDQFTRDNNKTANDALAQLQTIMAESVQLAGQEAQCRADQVAAHAKAALEQLIHILKKDGGKESYPIEICSISPKTIELSKNPRHLSISGDYLYDQPKPNVAILDDTGKIIKLSSDLVSRQTGYEMTVDLDEVKRDGLLNSHTRKILISSSSSSDLHEIPIEALQTCDDGIMDQDETDVDCGGKLCGKCAAKKMCLADSDCDGSACMSGRCGLHVLGSQLVHVDFGGGPGGDHNDQSSCPGGSVAIGFYAKTGNNFDQLALFCSALQPNGTIAPASAEAKVIGGDGGNLLHQSTCPNGEILMGIKGKSGQYLDDLQGECKLPTAIALQTSPAIDDSPDVDPSGGGNATEGHCPTGFAIANLDIREGKEIDHLSMDCLEVKRLPQ